MNLADALHNWAEKSPHKPALIEGAGRSERSVSYKDLAHSVQSAASRLKKSGLGPHSRAVIMQPVGIDLYIALLACFSCGITAIIIDPAVRREVIDFACAQTNPDAFIGPMKAHLLRVKHPGFRKIKARFHTSGAVPLSRALPLSLADASCPPVPLPPDHPALITFTSGSTGMPKVACRTHDFLQCQHHALSSALSHKEEEVDLVTLPIFGLANLASGMTSVIANTDLKFPALTDSDAILKQCQKHGITRCAASPAFFKKLFHDGLFPDFHTIYTGGAPVFPSFLRSLSSSYPHLRIVSVYGSTEAEPISHQDFSALTPGMITAQLAGEGLLVGKPVKEVQVKTDPSVENEVGEILVSGDHVLKGYLNAEQDAETKVAIDGMIWHRTGDLGRLDSDGNLWLLGRVTARFKTAGGQVIYPFATEAAAMNIEGVVACAVIQHQKLATLCYSGSPDIGELAEITSLMGIEAWVPLPSIPLDTRHNAKVNYPALRALL